MEGKFSKFSEFRKSDKSDVVASWSLTLEVVGLSNPFNNKYFCYWIQQNQWKNLLKIQTKSI